VARKDTWPLILMGLAMVALMSGSIIPAKKMGEAESPPEEAEKKSVWEKATGILGKVSAVAALIQPIILVLGAITAAAWFWVQSEASPKANISHVVTHRQLSDNLTWVHVAVTISNVGKRRLYLKTGTFRIQRILPLAKLMDDRAKSDPIQLIPSGCLVVPWTQVGNEYENIPIDRWFEPQEMEKLTVEFIIPSDVQTIKIYSFIVNDRNFGWTETTIYQLHN
jgi:hypothetical protein